jgi:glycosyltransferase involved in cell wall biosynthesis
MKILISAIACNPFSGSEALHGWMVCRSLARLGDLWLLVSAEHREGIEKARNEGLVPANMDFIFIGQHRGYLENRLLARGQGWLRYMDFSKAIFPIARELHETIKFDLSHHVTYSTWRVASPLWRLNVPFIWGPISGTEVFPLVRFGRILSPSAFGFELLRIAGGAYSNLLPEVHRCARRAFHIFAAHREAVTHLSQLRKSSDGISVLSYYSFSPERIGAMARNSFLVRATRPLKIFAAGNLEGRKGIAIALHGLARAKQSGVKFTYRITSRGPEFEHLQHLAKRLGISEEVDLGRQMAREDYVRELQDTDLYLLPSLREGGGLSMMEAMLAGCVPIVAACGGPGTTVTDECGVSIPVTSPKQMAKEIADAVIRFDSDRELLARMANAACRRIADNYTEEKFIGEISAVYQKALAS